MAYSHPRGLSGLRPGQQSRCPSNEPSSDSAAHDGVLNLGEDGEEELSRSGVRLRLSPGSFLLCLQNLPVQCSDTAGHTGVHPSCRSGSRSNGAVAGDRLRGTGDSLAQPMSGWRPQHHQKKFNYVQTIIRLITKWDGHSSPGSNSSEHSQQRAGG